MKTILLRTIPVFFFIINYSNAQSGQWAWIHGSSTASSTGSYGTQGVSSPSNEPPAFYEACEWTDTSGNFWLFGGIGPTGIPNDLWKFDPLTNEWTWMKGDHSSVGTYGIQGVPSPTNNPPGKSYTAVTWMDLSNNLWMFGGSASGAFNDLWKYDISTNTWTWMKGADTKGQGGTYGTIGVPNIANCPGARDETAGGWTDNAGDLWLFGGSEGGNPYGDLWRFNIATNTWTWMKGSSTTWQLPVFGTLGVEDPANTPGGRWPFAKWKDKSGNFWLFGGYQYNPGSRNDLWRFNPVTNNWTWISGTTNLNQAGFYGTKCTPSSATVPGTRFENRSTWVDVYGNLWMFGGEANISYPMFNDLWMYCISKNEWTWQSGDTVVGTAGDWGTLGVASPTNKPNGRRGAIAWTGKNGHLYLFGGTRTPLITAYNDLWEYTIDYSCGACNTIVLPVAALQASDSAICANDCISFTDHSLNATSWAWTFPGGTPSSSNNQNPQVCYLTQGVYNVTLVASNFGNSDTLTINNYISVDAAPPTPVITQAGTTLYCRTDPAYTSYQWYLDSTLINGATDTSLVISQSGNYNVQVSNENGCKVAGGINIILGLQNYMKDNFVSLSPNPASDKITIHDSQFMINNCASCIVHCEFYNVMSQRVYQSEIKNPQSEIDISELPPGIYFVQLIGEKKRWVGRFVKE